MAETPITTDLQVSTQSINIDIEAIAPLHGFEPTSYDVANMTITATIHSPTEARHRLVLAAGEESGTAAFARVVSGSKDRFKDVRPFRRLYRREVEILRPVLAKAGVHIDPGSNELRQLVEHARSYRIADILIPEGQQVLRIHASQKLEPVEGDARRYRFTMYAPQLSLAPSSNVRLSATVIFPLDFTATVDPPVIEALADQPMPNLVAGGHVVQVGVQQAYGWLFQADPKIIVSYRYS